MGPRLVVGIAVSVVGIAGAACGGGSGGHADGSTDASMPDGPDDGRMTPPDGSDDGRVPPPDAEVADTGTPGDAATDAGVDAGDPTAPTDCVKQTVTIGRAPTSSCAFDLPVSIDTSLINVRIARRLGVEGRVVCRVGGSGSCSPSGGWFMFDDETVALCDESCRQFESLGTDAVVIAELGCGSSFCRESCRLYDETCGGGSNCCPGYECHPSTSRCVPCSPVGSSCSTDDDRRLCCSNFCGEGGECCYDIDDPCTTDADCCSGACDTGFCVCPASEERCGSECVDTMTDDTHCGTCGNACTDGATCTDGSCVCGGSELYCSGACVDPDTDEAHCGGCDAPCRADQLCTGGSCGCPAGEVECSGACTDLDSDPDHCGDCTTSCSSVEMCSGGSCVCRSDLTLCDGMCVDTDTNDLHCGSCGEECRGMRRCVGGSCA